MTIRRDATGTGWRRCEGKARREKTVAIVDQDTARRKQEGRKGGSRYRGRRSFELHAKWDGHPVTLLFVGGSQVAGCFAGGKSTVSESEVYVDIGASV